MLYTATMLCAACGSFCLIGITLDFAAMSGDFSELRGALQSSDPTVRARSAERFVQLGEEARPAAVDLLKACADPDGAVREWVVAALEEIGAPLVEDLAAIQQLLEHRAADVAYWAATLLGRLRHVAKPATAALAKAVSSRAEPAVRQRAAWALGRIGPSAGPAAVDALTQAARANDPRLVRLAQQALDQIRE